MNDNLKELQVIESNRNAIRKDLVYELLNERERSLLDKLRGVPTCQRCRRWPSDVTAALFFSVCACVSMLYIYDDDVFYLFEQK